MVTDREMVTQRCQNPKLHIEVTRRLPQTLRLARARPVVAGGWEVGVHREGTGNFLDDAGMF